MSDLTNLYWACRASMSPSRARAVLGLGEGPYGAGTVATAWLQAKAGVRGHAAKDVLLTKLAQDLDEDEGDDPGPHPLRKTLRELGLTGVDWKLGGSDPHTQNYQGSNPVLFIGTKGPDIVVVKQFIGDYPEATRPFKPGKNVLDSVNKAVNRLRGTSTPMKWVVFPEPVSVLTDQVRDQLIWNKSRIPLEPALRASGMLSAPISQSKTIPLVELLWTPDAVPGYDTWNELLPGRTSQDLQNEMDALHREQGAFRDIIVEMRDHQPGSFSQTVNYNRATELAQTQPDVYGTTPEAVQDYYNKKYLAYQTIDDKVRLLNEELNRMELPYPIKGRKFWIKINEKEYPLSDTTLRNSDLTFFLTSRKVLQMGRSEVGDARRYRALISKSTKFNPYELLRTLEDALTSEPTELFIRLHQVIEWFEAKWKDKKTAGTDPNRAIHRAMVARFPSDRVAELLNRAMVDVLTV